MFLSIQSMLNGERFALDMLHRQPVLLRFHIIYDRRMWVYYAEAPLFFLQTCR